PRTSPTPSPSKISSPSSLGIRCMSSRASVDLPQPDSPTTPSVSPFSTVKDTSSTARTLPTRRPSRPPWMGKCFFRPDTISIGWTLPPRSRGSLAGTAASFAAALPGAASAALPLPTHLMRSHPYVHGLAQSVADEVERQRGDEDRNP